MAAELLILHFNDVYNIEPRKKEPVGGAARLVHTIKSFAGDKPLVLFSGDAFNPSLLSTITRCATRAPDPPVPPSRARARTRGGRLRPAAASRWCRC